MARYFSLILGAALAGAMIAAFAGAEARVVLLLSSAGLVAWAAVEQRLTFSLTAFLMVVAAWGMAERYRADEAAWLALPEPLAFSGSVEIVDRGSARSFFIPVTLRVLADEWRGGTIFFRAPLDFSFRPGEHLSFACALSRPENFDPGFDYRMFLAARGTGYACDRVEHLTPLSERTLLRSALAVARSSLERTIGELFPEPEAGLLKGLFIGGDALAPETKALFAKTGLSHIVAVSGYNMSLVAESLILFGLVLGLWRRMAIKFAVFGVALFLLFIDGSAASLRAALMAWFAFAAYFVGRPSASWNGLLLAATGMLLVDPLLVRYDVGFQLSFLATVALLVLADWFDAFAFFRTWYGKGAALFFATCLIEIFTAPVILSTFGTVSVIAPLANTLTLPLVPLAMLCGGVAVALGFLVPPLASLAAFPAWLLLAAITRGTEMLAAVPGAQTTSLAFSSSLTVLWYLGLSIMLLFANRMKRRYVLGMDH
jgi:competence protein ComEC